MQSAPSEADSGEGKGRWHLIGCGSQASAPERIEWPRRVQHRRGTVLDKGHSGDVRRDLGRHASTLLSARRSRHERPVSTGRPIAVARFDLVARGSARPRSVRRDSQRGAAKARAFTTRGVPLCVGDCGWRKTVASGPGNRRPPFGIVRRRWSPGPVSNDAGKPYEPRKAADCRLPRGSAFFRGSSTSEGYRLLRGSDPCFVSLLHLLSWRSLTGARRAKSRAQRGGRPVRHRSRECPSCFAEGCRCRWRGDCSWGAPRDARVDARTRCRCLASLPCREPRRRIRRFVGGARSRPNGHGSPLVEGGEGSGRLSISAMSVTASRPALRCNFASMLSRLHLRCAPGRSAAFAPSDRGRCGRDPAARGRIRGFARRLRVLA